MSINNVYAREILDSRGNPTIEVEIETGKGKVSAKVPSGASTGVHEAHELRDNELRYKGKGVTRAVRNVIEIITPAILGKDPTNQEEIDRIMINLDDTKNKTNLGANAILGVSMAVCRAGALEKGIPLYNHIMQLFGQDELIMPVPCMNVINGGKHAGNKLDIQEYMIVPIGASSMKEAVRLGSEVYHQLKSLIKDRYGIDATNVGDEGGFAPNLRKNDEPFVLLMDAIRYSGHEGKIKIGVDCAASEYFRHNDLKYLYGEGVFSGEEMLSIYSDYLKNYPIISLEDPFSQEDFETFSKMTNSSNIQIVGDDLLCTNVERIKMAIEKDACNALLLKVNQIGTVTESLEAARLAYDHKWKVMVSHRSGETDDDFIADLSVGIGCGQIKSGAPCRSERTAKYNRLMQIEDELERSGRNPKYSDFI